MISVVSNGVYATNGTTPKTLPAYLEYTVTYSDGVPISQNHLLEAGTTVFTDSQLPPWVAGVENSKSGNVTNVEIEGIVAPTSIACWFWEVGMNAFSFTANLNNLKVSNVTDMGEMFYQTGYNAATWAVTIPRINGGGISNTTSRMYGNTASTYAELLSGKSFTLAS